MLSRLLVSWLLRVGFCVERCQKLLRPFQFRSCVQLPPPPPYVPRMSRLQSLHVLNAAPHAGCCSIAFGSIATPAEQKDEDKEEPIETSEEGAERVLAAIDKRLVALSSDKEGVPYYRLHRAVAKSIARKKFICVRK